MNSPLRIIMSGGNGDLGKDFAPRILADGATVISIDPSTVTVPGVEHIRASILDRTVTQQTIQGADMVVHIAAWHGFHAFSKSKSAEEFWDLNMTGTFNLLEACAQAGVRKFIFISSSSVEDWPDLYGMTKRLGEELCRGYAELHGMQIIALRPRAFIPWWNKAVYRSKDEWASWFARGAIHLHDVTEAVYLAYRKLLQTDERLYEVLDLDGKHDFSEQDLSQWRTKGARSFLQERFPNFAIHIQTATFIPDEPPSYRDNSKAREALGFQPTYGFQKLLEEMFQQD